MEQLEFQSCKQLLTTSYDCSQELHSTRVERQQLNEQLMATTASADSAKQKLQALQAELDNAKQATADAQQQQEALSAQLQSAEKYAMGLKDALDKKNDEVDNLSTLPRTDATLNMGL